MAIRLSSMALAIGLSVIASANMADAQTQVKVDSTNGTSLVTFDSVTQKYSVTLTATASNATFHVFAEPLMGVVPSIADILVATTPSGSPSGFDVNLFIGESNAGLILPPASLDNLDFTGSGSVRLQRGLVDGDLGEAGQSHVFRVSEIAQNLDITGDAHALIEVVGGPLVFTGISGLFVGGNLYSGVSVNSTAIVGIELIEIQGSAIGTVATPAFIEADNLIQEIIIRVTRITSKSARSHRLQHPKSMTSPCSALWLATSRYRILRSSACVSDAMAM